jgi:hypothetical protein
MTIVFDDFVADTRRIYEQTLAFLGVPSDGRTEFPVVNESKVQRSEAIGYLITLIPQRLHNAVRELKRIAGIPHVPLNVLASINLVPAQRAPMPPDLRARLSADFADDVALLENELGRDLSAWKA